MWTGSAFTQVEPPHPLQKNRVRCALGGDINVSPKRVNPNQTRFLNKAQFY
jgi:hypothetical protein